MAKVINLRKHVKPKKKPQLVDGSRLKVLLAETPVRTSPKSKLRMKQGKTVAASGKLELIDKWRSEIFVKKRCFECKAQVSHSFMYRNTSLQNAKVYLCVMCEATVLERSFGKTDAMENAILVGRVESNRRRH